MGRWDEIDYPVLKTIYDLEGEKRRSIAPGRRREDVTASEIIERTEIDEVEVQASTTYMFKAGLIEGTGVGSFAEDEVMIAGVTPAGLQALDEWPSRDRISEILPDLLEALASQTVDSDNKTILSRAARVIEQVTAATIAAAVGEVTGLR